MFYILILKLYVFYFVLSRMKYTFGIDTGISQTKDFQMEFQLGLRPPDSSVCLGGRLGVSAAGQYPRLGHQNAGRPPDPEQVG